MSLCDECRVNILRYLDYDLRGQELEDFRSHLETCADCRANVEAEQALSHLLHQSRPLYSAPPALHASVSATVLQHSGSPARIGFYPSTLQMLHTLVNPARRVLNMRMLALVVLLLGFLFAFVPNIARQVDLFCSLSTISTSYVTSDEYLVKLAAF